MTNCSAESAARDWVKILADNWRGRNGNSTTGDSVRNSCADELEKVAARNQIPAPAQAELTADFVQALPSGKLDDSTYEKIETALDKIDAPCRSADGKWLALHERIAAMATQPQAAPPPDPVDITGWRLVPNVPTEEMWQAGRSADIDPGDSYTKVWCAMFDAAPNVDDCETIRSDLPQSPLVHEALEIAEDVLSRAPFSTAILPNGMHPQIVIEKIRAALAMTRPQSEGK